MLFAEGGSTSTSSGEHVQAPISALHNRVAAMKENRDQDEVNSQPNGAVHARSTAQKIEVPMSPTDGSIDQPRSVRELQESLLPANTRNLFARAAEIMHTSNDMNVMFLDASYAARSHEERPSSSGKRCQILGFAMESQSSVKGDALPHEMIPCESNFKWALEQYPEGYCLNYDAADDSGVPSDANSLEEDFVHPIDAAQRIPGIQTARVDREWHKARVKDLIPNVKSALFLPLWDFDRGRWFAGCFCWSTKTERALDGRLDLPFLKTFGHSIMQGKTKCTSCVGTADVLL